MGMQTISIRNIFLSRGRTYLLLNCIPFEQLIFYHVRYLPCPQVILHTNILLLRLVSVLIQDEPHGCSHWKSLSLLRAVIDFPLIPNGCIYDFSESELWIAYLVLIISETCKCLAICSSLLLTDINSVAIGFLVVKACEQFDYYYVYNLYLTWEVRYKHHMHHMPSTLVKTIVSDGKI